MTSTIETCTRGHSRVELFTITPKGARYCKSCRAEDKGAHRAKLGQVKKSKYVGVYNKKVQERIAKLETRIHETQQELLIQRARLRKGN